MGIIDTGSFTDSRNNYFIMHLYDTYLCTDEQKYKTEFFYTVDGTSCTDYWDHNYHITDVYTPIKVPNYNGRCAAYIKSHSTGEFIAAVDSTLYFHKDEYSERLDTHTYTDNNAWIQSSAVSSNVSNTTLELGISMNIPIFQFESDARDYLTAATEEDALIALRKALNWSDTEIEPETYDLNLINYGVTQTWTAEGLSNQLEDAIYHSVRGKMISECINPVALYPISGASDGNLKFGVKVNPNANFYIIWYSTDNKNWIIEENAQFPFDFFWRKRENEIGTFRAATIDPREDSENGFAFWENEERAQGFIDGTIPIYEATNWDMISSRYPTYNPTGEEETSTTMGSIWLRSHFSHVHLCTNGALTEIANNLFDTSVGTDVWDAIKKGVDMYGQNPMEVVQGLAFYPFDLASVFTQAVNQHYIMFGGYQLQLEHSDVYKVLYPDGYIDIGTFTLKRTFNDWRDFEPYTKLSVYLPYIGVQHLDIAKYYNKTITVRYYIDIRTTMCMVVLLCDGLLYDFFSGQIGIQMPITLTDFATYASNQINTILQGASSALSMSTGYCGSIATIGMRAASRVYAGENAGVKLAREKHRRIDPMQREHVGSKLMTGATAASEVATMGLAGSLSAMKTTFELVNNGIGGYNSTKGGSTSLLNGNLPQYVTFIFETLESQESPYLRELAGKPSNASGKLGDFRGYLECDDVMLICPIATDAERQEIIDLVCSGIYL